MSIIFPQLFSADGAWTDWSSYGACSQTCGDGTQYRTRTCTNPTPVGDGADCVGDSSESQACQDDPVCPSKY